MTIADDYINRVLDWLPRATPSRAQIGMELRGLIDERLSRGQSEGDVLRQLGDPLALAESYLAAVPLESAGFFRRVAAKLIDAASFLVGLVILAGTARAMSTTDAAPWLPLLFVALLFLGSVAFAVYTVVAESRYGQTLGKRLMGVRAVRESGARLSAGQAIVRQLPVIFEVFVIDALFPLFTEKNQRAFELLSKTRVVRV
jgi:uncharacterized RDD family membrane protein YckC